MTHSGRNKFEIPRFSSEDENHINKKLPKELLLRILSYLDVVSLCRCAQVSKLWNILALDGSNWQRIDLFDFQRDVEGPVIENISMRCGGFLRQLSLRGCESIGDGSMKTLAQSCPNIEDLNLNKCKKITDATCQALGKKCSKLQRINLDSCPSISDISLKALSDGCPLLTHVNVSWCQSITDNGVEALARGCPKLKSFICRGCLNVKDKSVTSLATYCPDLEVLNVQGCESITDASICRLGGSTRRVCVSGCARLSDAALAALAARCPALVTLELAQCARLTDAGFQALARSCRQLQRMDLEECALITDATLAHLALGCPRLERLTLSHCELITDYGIKQLSLSQCAADHLTVLGLDNCPLITDAALEHLTYCQKLQLIELYDCQLVTRNAIRKLRKGQKTAQDNEVVNAVKWAIDTGYRLIDTASAYKNEEDVGKGLAESGLDREDVFIVTKLGSHEQRDVLGALRSSLRRLNTTYLDLYLIHNPVAFKSDDSGFDIIDYVDTWKSMEQAKKLGLARSIGISNFNISQINRLIRHAVVKPAVLQVEVNLNLAQDDLLSYCKTHNIAVMAYTPFGSLFNNDANTPAPKVYDPVLLALAQKYNKSVTQVVLRFLTQRGVIPIPKSVHKERIEQNIDVFDFQLNEEEMETLHEFNKNYRVVWPTFWQEHPYFPFEKSDAPAPDPFKPSTPQ